MAVKMNNKVFEVVFNFSLK